MALWQVLLRGRAHNVRGKGKSGFIVLRQRTETVQVWMPATLSLRQQPSWKAQRPHPIGQQAKVCRCMAQAVLFVDDKTVSKGMVKYASAIPRESILDISGEVSMPETPVAGCSCSQVSIQ